MKVATVASLISETEDGGFVTSSDLKYYLERSLALSEINVDCTAHNSASERVVSESHVISIITSRTPIHENRGRGRCRGRWPDGYHLHERRREPTPGYHVETVSPWEVSAWVSPAHVDAGQVISLMCESTSSLPPSRVSWRSGALMLYGATSEQRPGLYGGTVTKSVLEVRALIEDNGRVFTCDANNGQCLTSREGRFDSDSQG
ncbi:uncharacterized protein [Palaemon carinicauda]|uniref:uncharacterized protein n=1 Tax=Palaemon carinicauda TaxID=392227 RepID=UPI0035B61289